LGSTKEAEIEAGEAPKGRKRLPAPGSAAPSSPQQRQWVGFAFLAFVLATAGANSPALQISDRVREADDHYLGRQDLDNLTKGLELLRAEVAQDPDSYEAWWRISKFVHYQARHSAGSAKAKLIDEGVGAGKHAVALEPNRVEGHFWLGANYELASESRGFFGFLRGLLLVDSIRKEMETVNRLDPDYEMGGGLRTLARLDYRAPFFMGGDKKRSIERLKKCLEHHPDDSLAMLYLSDSDMALGHRDEARQELELILKLCPDPQYGPELAENQEEARARVAKSSHPSK